MRSAEEPGNGLWPHQAEAVEKICVELGERGRATAVAACGTGKTLIGAECSVRLVPAGAVLIVVPTLELLSQTALSYVSHLGSAAGVIAAVCGDKQVTDPAAELTRLSAAVTTDPAVIAGFAARAERVTVFATYASLPVIIAAHAQNGLGCWGLVVVDEAHRTAGVRGQWAQIHENRLVPATRRLYLTATPRIRTLGGTDSVSMDDPTVFGRQVFQLPFAAAIESGLLADYRVAVVTVTDAEVAKLTAARRLVSVEGRAVSARMLGMQVALVKAVRDYGLRRVITYHGRVMAATRFATGLAAAIDLLPADDRPPWEVRARWVSGDMPPQHRRAALAALQHPGDSTVVVSNARVLAEGVDVPALDAVMFADPRDSVTDVVQAVGRALRRGGETGKIATIIVPIFLTEGENPQAALDGSDFDTVWRVVRALRAHDERIADYLDHRRQLSRPGLPEPRETGYLPNLLQIDGAPARVSDAFHRAILLRTVATTTSPWWENYGALVSFHAEFGHADVAYDYRTPDGYQLGRWLGRCRREYKAATLRADRVAKLEALGVDWDPFTTRWETGIAALHRFRAEHGHLSVAADYRSAEGHRLGEWLVQCRTRQRAGKLSAERVAELEALGVDWDSLAVKWEAAIVALRAFHTAHGHGNVAVSYVNADGFELGQWLRKRREQYQTGTLPEEHIAALESLDVDWNPTISRHAIRWKMALAALDAYRTHHGHTDVPATYVASDGFQLGKWLSRRREMFRAGTLPSEQATGLAAAGIDLAEPRWSRRLWNRHLEDLTAFRREYGHANPAQRHTTPTGFRIGAWISGCRTSYRSGELTAAQIDDLHRLGVDLGPQLTGGTAHKQSRWRIGIEQLEAYRNMHGHADVDNSYRTADGFRLGAWLAQCRRDHRSGTLPADRAAELETLGIDWRGPREIAWDKAIAALIAYRERHGHIDISACHVTRDGFRLGTWIRSRRNDYRTGRLSAQRAQALTELGIDWHPAGGR
ncbi:Helicase associated domain protein [Nocardia sp. NPDC057440]|uniref:DEAD/DEAH box helicase n=1 Tax=Nocardia sp. NPDC057440 TaxID=3346134 RepID=UPI00366BA738